MRSRDAVIRALRQGLIASCQADGDELLQSPTFMAAMAASAVRGGAVAIRACGAQDIRAIKAAVAVPIIGLTKRHYPPSPVYITPTWDDVSVCLEAGADIVAIDATDRPRPDGLSLATVVRRVRATSDALLMADVASLHEGQVAATLGFDLISTTLAGYTEAFATTEEPDMALVAALAASVAVPIVAEGRISTPAQAAEALRRGAWAVCVGKAITAPHFIAQLFVQALRDAPAVGEWFPAEHT